MTHMHKANKPINSNPSAKAKSPSPIASVSSSRSKTDADHILQLQRTFGNRAVIRMMQQPSIQRVAFKCEFTGDSYDTDDPESLDDLVNDLNDPDYEDNDFYSEVYKHVQGDKNALDSLMNQCQLFDNYVKRKSHVGVTSQALPYQKCEEIGNEAIKAARVVIPAAGNQLKDLKANSEAFPRAKATSRIINGFREFLSERGLAKSAMDFKDLHPFIKDEIAKVTHGGLCGDYAAVVYTYIRKKYPTVPVRIVKAKEFAGHSWVELESSDKGQCVVDAWPSVKRIPVPKDLFFATESTYDTENFAKMIGFQEPKVELMLKVWSDFVTEAQRILQEELDKKRDIPKEEEGAFKQETPFKTK